jgi:hypothetical protein
MPSRTFCLMSDPNHQRVDLTIWRTHLAFLSLAHGQDMPTFRNFPSDQSHANASRLCSFGNKLETLCLGCRNDLFKPLGLGAAAQSFASSRCRGFSFSLMSESGGSEACGAGCGCGGPIPQFAPRRCSSIEQLKQSKTHLKLEVLVSQKSTDRQWWA